MDWEIPFLDLSIPDSEEQVSILEAVKRVLKHGRLINGPEVEELEHKVAEYCGRKYAVGVNSGTDALFLALKSLNIGSGDEVITTSLSWIATANAVTLTGATTVFADISDDLNIDPESIKRLVGKHTKALLPVDYTGRICNMEALKKIANEHSLYLIEDSAQAFASEKKGKKAGSFGDMSCFSMNPMKVLAACGEAGMVLTDNNKFYERLLMLRYNGTINREICIEPSLNGRLDTLQSAILLERLRFLPERIKRRKEIASWYSELLTNIVITPQAGIDEDNVHYTYTILADRRDELKGFLASRGIETKIQYSILMPEQPAYRGSRGEYPNAGRLVQRILCLPFSEKITRSQVRYVAECVQEFYKK